MEQHLSQYRIFYEVAKAGNISRAAKELYISQPAISKAIGKLESSLGVSLFTRNSRGVHLTDEGELLFVHTKAAFEFLDRGERELKRIREFNIGHLKIGVSNTLCRYILLPYLHQFIQQYPHIKITIECQSSAHTLSMLEHQQIDLGVVAEPENKKSLAFLPVMDIQDTFVSTKNYMDNLKLREGENTDIFQTGNIMLLDRENMTRRYIDDYMAAHNIVPNQVLEVTTMDLLIEFARIGMGIGCVIREFVADSLADGSLIEIPLPDPVRKRTIGFSYNTLLPSSSLNLFLKFLADKTA